MKKISHYLIAGIIIVVFFGCGGGGGGGGSSSSPCADLNVRVFGGDQCDFSSSPVVSIVGASAEGQPVSVCSATMVTNNDLLTAAHCLNIILRSPGGAFVFAEGEFHTITAARAHPLYGGQATSPYDFGMVSIDTNLNVSPVPILISDPLLIGENITVYGYGRNEDSGALPTASDFRAGFMTISSGTTLQFAASFDDTGSAICQGDSGGPATQNINGVTSIVGVTSFTINGCQSGSVSGFGNIQDPSVYKFIQSYAPDITIR